MRSDEEEPEDLDPHSSKFRPQGQLMSYEEEPSFEGYLQVKVCSVEGAEGGRRIEELLYGVGRRGGKEGGGREGGGRGEVMD